MLFLLLLLPSLLLCRKKFGSIPSSAWRERGTSRWGGGGIFPSLDSRTGGQEAPPLVHFAIDKPIFLLLATHDFLFSPGLLFTHSLSPTPSHSLFHFLSFSLSHTHMLKRTSHSPVTLTQFERANCTYSYTHIFFAPLHPPSLSLFICLLVLPILSLSFCHTHTHTLSHMHTLKHTHTHTQHQLFNVRYLSLIWLPFLTVPLSSTSTHTFTLPLSLSLSLSLSLLHIRHYHIRKRGREEKNGFGR